MKTARRLRRESWVACCLLAFLGSSRVLGAAPSVTKVEPPNWWPDHTVNPVRVLIRGSGLTGASVASANELQTGNVSVSQNGTYLFVDVTIPRGAKPGDYPLQIKTAEGSAIAPFRIDTPLDPEGRFQGFSPDDLIYLIMPDRFANGDASNDDPAIAPGLFNRKESYYYHGGDLQGVIDHLPYLKSLGVTALWLTPIYDNNNKMNVRPPNTTSYHGYGAVDYYAVEEHFGDLKLLRRMVDEAHRIGIKVIQDQVANHVGPAHPWVTDSPTAAWFNGTAAHHLVETFNLWDLIDPHAAPQLVHPVLQGWFVDLLPDMNQNDPEVAKYEIQNALWWIGTAGFDGIRQDTLPYVPRTFWAQWSKALKQQYPKLRVVGEVLDPNPAIVSFFQTGTRDSHGVDTGIDTLFDYPVYFSLRDAFTGDKKIGSLIKQVANDRLYPNPAELVTILGDHDVKRFMSEPGATFESMKLAFTFLLTARGIPVIYYGDEIAMKGGDDPDNRQDFPGGWADDPHNAFDKAGRTAEQSAMFDYVQKLGALRAKLDPLRRGEMINLTEDGNGWIYARRDGSGTVLVAINDGQQPAKLKIELEAADKTFRSLLGVTKNVSFQAGKASISLPPMSAEIYTDTGSAQ